ncbi:MAG: hypothetical protein AAF617_14890, partial [Bacteroidota bacterium]
MTQKFDNTILSDWLNLRTTKLHDFSEETSIVANVQYEGLKNVTRVHIPSDVSVYYFFDTSETCVMVYINDKIALENLSVTAIQNQYGAPQELLRSRVGKRATQHVYAKDGFAFSVLEDTVVFFEIFPNCDIET